MGSIKSQFLKSVLLPIADVAMKTSISSTYRQIKRMHLFSKEEIKYWQIIKLQKLIKHAYHHTSYYKKIFDNSGMSPGDIYSVDDLRQLPVLTRDDVRNNFKDLIPTNISNIPHKKSATGGSSGDPMLYWLDHNSWSFSNADKTINWERAGYNYGDKYVALGSTSLFIDNKQSLKHKLYYYLKNKIGLSGVNMSDHVCEEYVELIKKDNIRFIYGYASSIYLLAKYLLKTNQKLNIVACFTTSEILTKIYRNTIEEALNCNIIDCYGAHDGGITAFAHQENIFEVGYNCIVRQKQSNTEGIGAALLTDLTNYAMPLINYQLGDEVQIKTINETYAYNGQIINQVIGRTSDIIYLENGNVLTGPGFTILFKDLPVEHYYIEKDAYNSIKCSIVKCQDFNYVHENIIYSTFKKQMGPNSKLKINFTDKVGISNSGKCQYFKSND